MRRNMSSRGHNNSSGPLMTNHIQLHDLDLELELLKRKREMIEKQQKMLGGYSRPRPFDYDSQPRPLFSGPPFNAIESYSNLYEPLQSVGYNDSGLLGKRPRNDQPWQNQRHSSGPQSAPKRKYNSSPGSKMNQSRPEPLIQGLQASNSRNGPQQWNRPQAPKAPKYKPPSQKFNNANTNKPVSKNFKPSKIGKPKPAAPNKLASYPTSERAKLVNTAVDGLKQDENDPNFILHDDQVPSQQLAGRLELALGNILKEIKTKYAGNEQEQVRFQTMSVQRQIKQAIRERLRSVMMGKYVGKVGPIVDSYRKIFPVTTDAEIVQSALATKETAETKHLSIKLDNTGTAYKYIKHNLDRLVGVTLDEIFTKVQELYLNHEDKSAKEICNLILAETIKMPELNKEIHETGQNESKTENVDINPNENQNDNKQTEEVNGIGDNVEPKQAENKVEGSGEAVTDDGKPADDENKEQSVIEADKPNDEAAAKLDSLVLSLLRRRLSHLLPRYKYLIMKVLNVSGSYQITRDTIVENAKEKLKIDRHVKEAQKSFTEKEARNVAKNNGTLNSGSKIEKQNPYMVKILGRPTLPKKAIMQNFLKPYKPTSVKKHRTMHLLFVSFDNKENFDKIVALNQASFGHFTISIKASINNAAKPNDSLNTSAASLNNSTDTLISSDLDDQISNLLTSIRKDEENKNNVDTDENKDVKSEKVELDVDTNDVVEMEQESAGKDKNINLEEDNVKIEDVAKVESKEVAKDESVEVAKDDSKEVAKVGTEEVVKVGTEEDAKVESEEVTKVESEEAKDKVEELKNEAKESGRATPTRSSSRLAPVTPSSIRTRRASRLAN